MNATKVDRFWEKPLDQLDPVEWEALCDGCGRCCLKKLEDEQSGETLYTGVVCRYFDQPGCQCSSYKDRQTLVPDCVVLDPMVVNELNWMPDTCAYKIRSQGLPLPDWHPLIAGSRDLMNELGISISGKVISEEFVHPQGLEEHIIRWVKATC